MAINTGNHLAGHTNPHSQAHAHTYTFTPVHKSTETDAAEGSASSMQHEVASLMAADMVRFPSLKFFSQDSFQAAGQMKAL